MTPVRARKGPRVLVAGSLNMDLVATLDRHPLPGETVLGNSLAYFPGGKGANQAVAAARAGARVVMLGAVGDDAFGTTLTAFLDANGVDVRPVAVRAGVRTGTAMIFVAADGENEIVVIPGTNSTVDDALVTSVDPAAGDVVVAQYETPRAATQTFFARGRAVGARCILNPAPAGDVPDALLALVDVLVVNETELDVVAFGPDPVQSYEELRRRGFAGALVVTLGARGAVALLDGEVVDVAGRPVAVTDTTGAGDCFVGYLAGELANGGSVGDALAAANVAASLCVQRAGAGPSMPRRDEVRGVSRDDARRTPG